MVLKFELHQNYLESWDRDAAGLGWDDDLCVTEHSRMLLDSDKLQWDFRPRDHPSRQAGLLAGSGVWGRKQGGEDTVTVATDLACQGHSAHQHCTACPCMRPVASDRRKAETPCQNVQWGTLSPAVPRGHTQRVGATPALRSPLP